MLPKLTMLPLPRAAIFGASAATRKYAARTFAAKSRSYVSHVQVRGRPEPGEPGVVDQHTDRADLLDEVVYLRRIAKIGGDETGLSALGR